MKKIILVTVSAVLVFMLAACSSPLVSDFTEAAVDYDYGEGGNYYEEPA